MYFNEAKLTICARLHSNHVRVNAAVVPTWSQSGPAKARSREPQTFGVFLSTLLSVAPVGSASFRQVQKVMIYRDTMLRVRLGTKQSACHIPLKPDCLCLSVIV